MDPRVIISKRVLVGDENIHGVIGAMAIHLQTAEDRSRVLGYSDIYVDIGAKDKAEAERKAPKGTYIAFETPYVEFWRRLRLRQGAGRPGSACITCCAF